MGTGDITPYTTSRQILQAPVQLRAHRHKVDPFLGGEGMVEAACTLWLESGTCFFRTSISVVFDRPEMVPQLVFPRPTGALHRPVLKPLTGRIPRTSHVSQAGPGQHATLNSSKITTLPDCFWLVLLLLSTTVRKKTAPNATCVTGLCACYFLLNDMRIFRRASMRCRKLRVHPSRPFCFSLVCASFFWCRVFFFVLGYCFSA